MDYDVGTVNELVIFLVHVSKFSLFKRGTDPSVIMDRAVDKYVSNCHLFLEKFAQCKNEAEEYVDYIKIIERQLKRRHEQRKYPLYIKCCPVVNCKLVVEERSALEQELKAVCREVESSVDQKFSSNNDLLLALDDLFSGVELLVSSQIQRCQDRRILQNEIVVSEYADVILCI